MKKNIKRIMMVICLTAILTACKQDEIDVNNSIFDDTTVELTGFDKWLDDNYRLTYNMRFLYKYEDIESDLNYNLIPAKIDKSIQLAQLIKFLWLDTYTEVAGIEFMRTNTPRMISLVGSAAWRTASKTTGTAENGLKITLYNINEFDVSKMDKMNKDYFTTLHHEFTHILNQKKMFDLRYGDLSATMYVGSSWSNYSDAEAAAGGMVSTYSASSVNEDFAEVISFYISATDEWWVEWYELAGEHGSEIIKKKIEFAKNYMKKSWNLDLDKLRSVVRRRTMEVTALEIKTEF